MTDSKKPNRLPFALLLIGLFVISAAGVYAYQQRGGTDSIAAAAVPGEDAEAALRAAGVSAGERKATEAVVRAYLLKNPEVITEAIAVLQNREAESHIAALKGVIDRPFAGNVAGNPNGDVTIVEFSDYNCGFCRASVPDVERLVKGDGNIRLVYREVPLLAPSSRTAALWALAAAKQGKHDAFHKALFAAGRPDDNTLRKVAQAIGMNVAAAAQFAGSAEAKNEIDGNLAMMQQVGFNGTPTFIIGNQILQGAQGYIRLRQAVDRARKAG